MPYDPKRIETHQLVETVDELLDALLLASQQTVKQIIVVHVSWHGCSGCLGPLEAALLDLEQNHNVFLLEVPWRSENGQFAYDYRYRITAVYRTWEQLVLGKLQRIGGFQEVETYPVPPWDRPHFPQVFLLDNRAIDQARIGQLKVLHGQGELINNGNEIMLVKKENHTDAPNYLVRDLLRNTCASECILLQLLNEHLFERNDEELQERALVETVRCAQAFQNGTANPEICIEYLGRYVAKRIWRG